MIEHSFPEGSTFEDIKTFFETFPPEETALSFSGGLLHIHQRIGGDFGALFPEKLKELHLDTNDLYNVPVIQLRDFIAQLSLKSPQLEILNISDNALGRNNGLDSDLANCLSPTLKVLKLSKNELYRGCIDFFKNLSNRYQKLEQLELDFNELGRYCIEIESDNFMIVSSFFPKTLKAINLSDNFLSTPQITELQRFLWNMFNRCPELGDLNIGGNGLRHYPGKDEMNFLPYLSKKLQHMVVDRNDLHSSDISIFLKDLLGFPALELLDLSGHALYRFLDYNEPEELSVSALFPKNLKWLGLRDVSLSRISSSEGEKFFKTLSDRCLLLEDLDLQCNNLSRCVRDNWAHFFPKTLKRLYLDNTLGQSVRGEDWDVEITLFLKSLFQQCPQLELVTVNIDHLTSARMEALKALVECLRPVAVGVVAPPLVYQRAAAVVSVSDRFSFAPINRPSF